MRARSQNKFGGSFFKQNLASHINDHAASLPYRGEIKNNCIISNIFIPKSFEINSLFLQQLKKSNIRFKP